MQFAIFLRKRLVPNKFREIIFASINSGQGDEVVICSGFFQEAFRAGLYRVSQDARPSLVGCLARNHLKVTTVGVHNYGWFPAYRNFVASLRARRVPVIAKYRPGHRWHAKIFLYLKNGKPILGIVGSSNMTSRAFGVQNPFNFEADIVMWTKPMNRTLKPFVTPSPNEPPYDTIIGNYLPAQNGSLTIAERLQGLYDDLNLEEMQDL